GGGGRGGREAARVAALRGHRVSVWEEAPRVGGRWAWLQRGCITERLHALKALRVPVEMGRDCTATAVAAAGAAVVLATPRLHPVPPQGLSGPGVVMADAVLDEGARVGQRVAVLGGGSQGLEAAFFLANRGHQVLVLEPGPALGEGLELRLPAQVQERLKPLGARFCLNARPVSFIRNRLTFAVGPAEETAEVDTVVVALGYRQDDSLAGELRARGVEVHTVPVCSQPLLAHPASVGGAAAARRV
ncbi:MAG: FAD-dependent oxidoreductase, partial [Chloroflexota bacterium]